MHAVRCLEPQIARESVGIKLHYADRSIEGLGVPDAVGLQLGHYAHVYELGVWRNRACCCLLEGGNKGLYTSLKIIISSQASMEEETTVNSQNRTPTG